MIGIAADDVTGANDIGIMFAKHGYRTVVYSDYAGLRKRELAADGVQVCVLNTESRYDPPEVAAAKVREATARLREFGCSLYFKKSCSVLRGNPGAEFDAMADELGERSAVLVAAFPKNGRQTFHGYHFVHRRLLSESEFTRDPVNPTREANLAKVVAAQSSRPVTVVHLEEVRAGKEALAARLKEIREQGAYALCDALDDEDLIRLAEVCAGERMLGGSSALAEFLPAFLAERPAGPLKVPVRLSSGQGVLVVAGSVTPQTQAQVTHLKDQGWPMATLDSLNLFTPEGFEREVEAAVESLREALADGRDALLRVANLPEEVRAAKERGREQGLSEAETSRLVSGALAEAARRVIENLDLKGLVVAGGDTSAMVLQRLGIGGNLVLEEIEPGLPSGLSLGKRRMLVVLKSGSFGKPAFLADAVRHLRSLGGPAPERS